MFKPSSYVAFITFYIFMSSASSATRCGVEKFSQYQMQYCLYTGNGPLLILEGSQGNDMTIWPKSFLRKLNQFSSILIYNRIGYGQSYYYKDATYSVNATNVAKRLHELLCRLEMNKPIILVAHSIGGIYAQYFIRNYPANVAALVMIDADSSFEPQVDSPFQSKAPEKKGSIGYLEASAFNQSMNQVNHSPPFPNIPLLVITATDHGSDKKTEELWQKLQNKIVNQSPQGQQITAQGSGHFVFQDDPSLVVNAIHHFIRVNHIK